MNTLPACVDGSILAAAMSANHAVRRPTIRVAAVLVLLVAALACAACRTSSETTWIAPGIGRVPPAADVNGE